MTTRAQKIRLGIFMLLATLLLVGSVATLAGLKMWNPRDRYVVRFRDSVSGLEAGSTVKMKGVRVGQVERINIDDKDVESVVVTLALNPNTPIKTDTRAVMTAIGITGLKFIELTGGSAHAPRVPPNKPTSVIPPGESTLQTLTGKATDIAKKTEGLLNNLLPLTGESNRVRVRQLLDNANALLAAWTELASGDTPRRVRRILANVDRMTVMLEKSAASFNKLVADNGARVTSALIAAEGASRSIQRSVANLQPQATLTEINKTARALRGRIDDPSISKALAALGNAAASMSTLTGNLASVVRRRDRQLNDIFSQLNRAAADLKIFARSIRDRPSLLLRGETRKERSIP